MGESQVKRRGGEGKEKGGEKRVKKERGGDEWKREKRKSRGGEKERKGRRREGKEKEEGICEVSFMQGVGECGELVERGCG